MMLSEALSGVYNFKHCIYTGVDLGILQYNVTVQECSE